MIPSATQLDTAAVAPRPEPVRILIVDDETTVRRVCAIALRLDNWKVESEGSSPVALERLVRGERFDVVVLDYSMPEMDGVEFLRVLRDAALDAPPSVLMMSAHADGTVARQVLELGVWDLMAKPLLPEEIRRRVQRLLDRRQAAADGRPRAQSLLLATQRRWGEARAALPLLRKSGALDELLRGLYFEMEGDHAAATEAFFYAHWWSNWAQQGAEIWTELSRRLDACEQT